MKADIGLIGLAVMGENLALNIESKGFFVAVYEREPGKAGLFLQGRGKGKSFIAADTLKELADSLKKPRKVLMMIKAGKPVDDTIELLLGFLEKGDIIIDGGNSNYNDTMRRAAYAESKGLLYMGAGVSGGEEGALNGPSIMPGGNRAAYDSVKHILQAICAKAGGEPCCDYVGPDGAGHFVKMVHNGIEYGDMQLICEAYDLLKHAARFPAEEISGVFESYNKGRLESYLIQITADILGRKDEDGGYIVDKILDCAGQKGTGKWAVISSMEEGVPLTLIAEAVYARTLSSMLDERKLAAQKYPGCAEWPRPEKKVFAAELEKALYAAKLISYTQGFQLMKSAAKTYNWDLDYGKIALMWRGGCIIRSVFLGRIKEAFTKDHGLSNLLLDSYFSGAMKECELSLRGIIKAGIDCGVALPAFSAALSYFDGMRRVKSPANLLQAQRDYFGAHTYERTDRPRGEFFHTDWTGKGGGTTSNNYNA